MVKVNETIFREYDIRGVADTDLDTCTMQRLSRACGWYLGEHHVKTITVGCDCRLSSERISEELIQGLLDVGIDVVDIGVVPTPVLYFSVFELNTQGGIMVTGSHNPPEYNGLKICRGKSTIHGEEIQKIKELCQQEKPTIKRGKRTSQDVREQYIANIARNIHGPIELKVVLDHGNGTSGIVAGEIYRRMGCDVVELFAEPDGRFPNHHPDPTVLDNLRALINTVKNENTLLGIAFDGDADRIGVVDNSGKVIFGDELLVLFARDILATNPGAKIISEVKASYRLYQDIADHGGIPIMWKTGHSLIKAKMKAEKALLAGEMSGHMFFSDRYYGFDDAIYAGARLLEIINKSKQSPAMLLSNLPESVTTPEIRVDCRDDIKFEVVERARNTLSKMGHRVVGIDGARVEFPDGWGLVRASNTQPALVYRFEANSNSRLNEIRGVIENVMTEELRRLEA